MRSHPELADLMPDTPTPAATPEPASQPRSLLDLYLSFTWLALQGFGGAMAIAQRELVDKKRWLTNEGFAEEWSVAQILPGPNVMNLAVILVVDAISAGAVRWRHWPG